MQRRRSTIPGSKIQARGRGDETAPAGRAMRHARRGFGVAVAVAAAAAGVSGDHGTALAQTALEDSVANRARPDFDPIGIVVGPAKSFGLFPTLGFATEYTDNLFRAKNSKVSDEIFLVSPGFNLRSDWIRHGMVIGATATIARHVENSSENWVDFDTYATGRLDIGDGGSLAATAKLRRGHEARGSPDDQVQTEPTVFYVGSLDITGAYAVDALAFRAELSARRRNFLDAGLLNNDDRDRNEYALRGRVAYEVVPGSAAFVEGAIDIRDFDKRVDDNGLRRSSNGYELLAGGSFDISGVTFAEIGLGYRRQEFDDPTLKPVAGLSFSGRLTWNPTDILTVNGTLRRLVRETTVVGASAAFSSVFKLKADYELRDNLLLNTSVEYEIEEFKGANRTDDLLTLELGARYMLGSLVSLGGGWTFEDRGSDAPGGGYTANTARLSATLRF